MIVGRSLWIDNGGSMIVDPVSGVAIFWIAYRSSWIGHRGSVIVD